MILSDAKKKKNFNKILKKKEKKEKEKGRGAQIFWLKNNKNY